MSEYAYAEQHLEQVPTEWTLREEISLDFIILETLEWAGKVEMRIERLYGPNNAPRGCRHSFRRSA